MVPVPLLSTVALPDSGGLRVTRIVPDEVAKEAIDHDDQIKQQFHGFLLAEVCKGCLKTNRLIAGDSSLSLAGNSALEETFWNNVLTTVVEQSRWNGQCSLKPEGQSS